MHELQNQQLTVDNEYVIYTKGAYNWLLVEFKAIQVTVSNDGFNLRTYGHKKDHRGNLPRQVRINGRIFWTLTPLGYDSDIPDSLKTNLCTNNWFGVTEEDIKQCTRWRKTWR